MAANDPHRNHNHRTGEYLSHFLKFLATFVVIISLSLFFFSFTAGA